MSASPTELDERLALARRAWPAVMAESDIVDAARVGLEIAATVLEQAWDEIRAALRDMSDVWSAMNLSHLSAALTGDLVPS